MQIPSDVRTEMLLREWEHSMISVQKAIREVSKEREIRLKTMRKNVQRDKAWHFLKQVTCLSITSSSATEKIVR